MGRNVCILFAWLAIGNLAHGWTAPAIISNTGTNFGLMPRVAPGFGGKLYVTWHQASWGIYFRERTAQGVWGSITTIRQNSTFSADTGVTEDAQGRPHVVYIEQDGAGTRLLIHQYRINSTWIRTVLSSGNEESTPAIDTDATGRVHVVYAAGSNNQHYVYHRIWTDAGGWGPVINVGTGAIESGRVGYHRPDMQASGNGLHLCWIQPGGDRYVVRYRRFDGTSWLGGVTIGTSVGATWMSNARIAVADASTIVATWTREVTAGSTPRIYWSASTDGGVTWTPQQQLAANETAPENMFGRSGKAFLVCGEAPAIKVYTWSSGAWDAGVRVNPTETFFTGWGDVTQTVDSAMHVVYYTAVNSGNSSGGVDYTMQPASAPTGTVTGRVVDAVGPVPLATVSSSSGGQTTSGGDGTFSLAAVAGVTTIRASMLGYNNTDVPNVMVMAGQTTAIGDIVIGGIPPMSANTNLSIEPGNGQLSLTWKNSTSVNFAGTAIVFRTDRSPVDVSDGTLAADIAGSAGANASYTHTGLTNGVRIYYGLFAHNNHPVRTYAPALSGHDVPFMVIDRDRDGDVDMSDFAWFQTCMTGNAVPYTNAACADADRDSDFDIDTADLNVFLGCLSGPDIPATANCLP